MRRAKRATVVGVLGALAALLVGRALPSCGDRYEPPCRVTGLEVVLAASALTGRLETLAEGKDGEIIALSRVIDARRQDGGVERDAGDGGDSGDAGGAPPAFIAPAVVVVVVAAGATAPRLVHTFSPPGALVARRDSTASVAVTFTGDGALFHWIETTRATAADGTKIVAAASKRQRVDLAGQEGPLVADPALACRECELQTAFAALGATTAAIVRREPAASASLSAKGITRLVTFDPTGRTIASVDLVSVLGGEVTGGGAASALGGPELGTPSPPTSLRLYARGGRFVARLGRSVALFDESLALRAGPWSLPTSGAEIDTALGDLDIAWFGSLSSEDGGPSGNVGDLPDLLFESRRPSGSPRVAPVRISTTGRASYVRRNEDRAGVLHAADGTIWFTLVGAAGHKLGGDLALPPAPGPSPAAADPSSGPSAGGSAGAQLLFSVDRTHFVVWSTGGDLTRETITCDP